VPAHVRLHVIRDALLHELVSLQVSDAVAW
jgi:hypothetical protein